SKGNLVLEQTGIPLAWLLVGATVALYRWREPLSEWVQVKAHGVFSESAGD
ncbi:MAG: hypothetical protein ACI8UP_002843, partial [Porticoccaceae bacterium]